ncbi:MAG: hypothetical protein ABJE95_32760 [Byssovorax sp.]
MLPPGRRLVFWLAHACSLGSGLACSAPPPALPPSPGAHAAEACAAPIELEYEGTLDREGHFARPFARATVNVRWHVVWDGGATLRLDWTEWEADRDRAAAETATTWFVGDRAWSDGPVDAVDARALRAAARSTLPCATPRHQRVAHPRLGDVVEDATFAAPVVQNGVSLPSAIHLSAALRDNSWVAELRLTRATPIDARSSLLRPPVIPAARLPLAPRITEVASGVWTFDLDDVDARTVVVELPEGLAAIDAPLGSDVGERLVDAIETKFPDRSIRYLFVGHYHPHYTGGARAFLAAGATVVAPPKTAAFVDWLAARPFTLAPDRFAREHASPQIQSFEGRFEVGDAARGIIAINIGAASAHTDEYTVFFVTGPHVLIEDDVGWFSSPEGGLRASGRARGVFEALAREKLDVTTMLQVWPVRTQEPTLSFDAWRSLVVARGAGR